MAVLKLILLCLLLVQRSYQHARLMEPPSRASMWRVGFPTPKDQDDNQSYCGGFGVQQANGGKCGICGDAWNDVTREHEAPGGIYATGIITKTYKQGSYIPVIVDITANHQGYFIFKLCPNNNIFEDPDQSCFDQLPLWVGGGDPKYKSRRYPITDYVTGLRMVYVRLPLNVTCQQCILQWTYVAGNNWGSCEDGTSGLGCGPQETFRSCADIEIVRHPYLSIALKTQNDDDQEEAFYEEALLENSSLKEESMEAIRMSSTKKKEALLRKKKILLEQVLQKLRQLIIQSQMLEKDFENDDHVASPSRTAQIAPPPGQSYDDNNYEGQVKPWWDRIISNRHRRGYGK